jgi:hypothetical protein
MERPGHVLADGTAFGGDQIVHQRPWHALIAAALLGALAAAGPLTLPVSAQTAPAGVQLASVVLAHGVKQTSLLGRGDVTPVDPGTSFVQTDLPYALVKINSAPSGTALTLRLVDPNGIAYSINVATPKHGAKPWQSFQFAAPLYILGTDLEGITGGWHFQVLANNQVMNDTAFEWDPATAQSLRGTLDAVNAAPTDADLHWRYGAALALFNQDPPAITQLQDAIRLNSKYALYHITLGRVYEREGKNAQAASEFQAALGIHGSFYDAVFQGWAQAHLNHLRASR